VDTEADDHEQMGRFLRHAFPFGLESFSGLANKNGESDFEDAQLRGEPSIKKTLLALIHQADERPRRVESGR
jgi:hypothetical protein